MPMNICLVSDQYAPSLGDLEGDEISGIALHTANMVEGLLSRNHKVILITNMPQTRPPRDFTYIHVKDWPMDKTRKRWFSFSLNLSRRIQSIYQEHRFDIFHSLDAKQGVLAARRLSVPTIGNVNDYYSAALNLSPVEFIREYGADWAQRYVYHVITRLYENKYFKNYDVLVANSAATLRNLSQFYAIDRNKFVLMHKALVKYPDKHITVQEKKNGEYTVLMVGTNLQRKGIYYLIDAAPAIVREVPNIRFQIVGKQQELMLKRCKALGLEKYFVFCGNVKNNQLPEHYLNADIFIMPSLMEGFGMTIVEAMSYGLPVIGTRGTGMEDSIEDGLSGLLIPPKSAPAITDAVLRLLNNTALRKQLSENALTKARSFNSAAQVENTLILYKNMIEKGGRALR